MYLLRVSWESLFCILITCSESLPFKHLLMDPTWRFFTANPRCMFDYLENIFISITKTISITIHFGQANPSSSCTVGPQLVSWIECPSLHSPSGQWNCCPRSLGFRVQCLVKGSICCTGSCLVFSITLFWKKSIPNPWDISYLKQRLKQS